MALIKIDHLPETIKVNSPLYMIIPEPGKMNDIPIRDRKILYLLHGLSDDASAWQRYTSIEIYARLYGLVVVMPSFGRSIYIDQPNGQYYFTYLVDELPQYLEDVFGIVPHQENTLIAGLSMGGYGAMKAAFLHPEKYFTAASFSGVLSLNIMSTLADEKLSSEFSYLFGDLTKLPGSMHDPAAWLQKAVQNKTTLPRLLISCGKQDEVYPLNMQFHEACKKSGIEVEYRDRDGKHEWTFWDLEIQWFLSRVLDPIE
jgi:putative tributyrin esterase